MAFEKGNTLGAAGRPRGGLRLPDGIREMLSDGCTKAAKVLLDALDAKYTLVGKHGDILGEEVDHNIRLRAADMIMCRLYGKPTETIQGPDGEPVKFDVSVIAGNLRKLAGE